MTPEQAKALREPFPAHQIGRLPKGGTTLDFVGHAAVTDRLLSVDPGWCWEPDRTADGRWDVQTFGSDAVLTGTLTVCGVTRPCVGTAPAKSFELLKQLQSDAIRNGAMRFGVALDLWSKEDLTPPELQPIPVAEAKARLVAALGGDKALARKMWGTVPDGTTVTPAVLDDLLAKATQASPPDGVGGDAADRESEVALETGDAGPGRAAASPAARQGAPGPADPEETS